MSVGGIQRLLGFHKCGKLDKLTQHLADWQETLTKYGRNFMKCPEELRTMILGIIPTEFENELVAKDLEYPTWQSIVAFWAKKCVNLRHRELAAQVRDPKPASLQDRGGGNGRLNAFGAKPEAAPSGAVPSYAELASMVQDFQAQGGARRPPPGKGSPANRVPKKK